MSVIDAEAMALALVACLVPPLAKLNPHKPSQRMCMVPMLALMTWMAVGFAINDVTHIFMMIWRPWYTGGTGTAYLVSIFWPDCITAQMQAGRCHENECLECTSS